MATANTISRSSKSKAPMKSRMDRRIGDTTTPSPGNSNALKPAPYPEIVIGLVGPVGIDLNPITAVLVEEFTKLRYRAEVIRLSEKISDFFGKDFSKEAEDKRLQELMNLGTDLREGTAMGEAVALLGIAEIVDRRLERCGGEFSANAFILRSLKHPHEVDCLRSVYGKGFFLISVYTPREARVGALAAKITRSRHGNSKNARSRAESAIERDESEELKKLGQDVKDAFPLADLFVDARNRESLRSEISRFLELIFGNLFHTPSRDEHGMYFARAAALRSADLGRQVGAAIVNSDGDVVTIGCNDVPRAGGGQYWPGDQNDARDFRQNVDPTVEERAQIIAETLERFNDAGLIVNTPPNAINALTRRLISGDLASHMKGARIMSLLEFGRCLHAEMAALVSAARQGKSVMGSTLYSTTFPCHMCARHIIGAGIMRVVYVEPYPKSKAKGLHFDSLSVDPEGPETGKVTFEPFVGIAPRQHEELFSARDNRKAEDGSISHYMNGEARPRFNRFQNTYRDIEDALVSDIIPELYRKMNINLDLLKQSENKDGNKASGTGAGGATANGALESAEVRVSKA